MAISASDVIPLSHARANFSELAEDVRGGAEKLITKNGEAYIAIIDAKRLDYYHRLERERIHLLLIDDAKRSLADITAGRTHEADAAIAAATQAYDGLVAQRIDDLAERLPNALNARAAQVALRLTNAGTRLRPALLTARLERSHERLAGASARTGSVGAAAAHVMNQSPQRGM